MSWFVAVIVEPRVDAYKMIFAVLRVVCWEISGNLLQNFSVLGSRSALNYKPYWQSTSKTHKLKMSGK